MQLLEAVGLIDRKYQQQLDETTILEVQALWNESGGTSNLFVESSRVVPVVLKRLENRAHMRNNSATMQPLESARSTKTLLTLKSSSTASLLSVLDSSNK